MELESIEFSFLSIFTLTTFFIFLIVSKYSYHKLKEKLGLYRLSRRGYRRTALEDRLINHMILDTTGLLV